MFSLWDDVSSSFVSWFCIDVKDDSRQQITDDQTVEAEGILKSKNEEK